MSLINSNYCTSQLYWTITWHRKMADLPLSLNVGSFKVLAALNRNLFVGISGLLFVRGYDREPNITSKKNKTFKWVRLKLKAEH